MLKNRFLTRLLVLVMVFGTVAACDTAFAQEEDTQKDEAVAPGRVTAGARAGLFFVPNVDEFSATYQVGNVTTTYSISGTAFVGAYPYARFNITDQIGIEAAYGLEGNFDDISLQTVSGMVVYTFKQDRHFRPYVKGGIVWGELDMANTPGDFESGTGLILGGGFETGGQKVSFTLDVLYRDLKNDYNRASGATTTSDDIDLSGLGVLGGIAIKF